MPERIAVVLFNLGGPDGPEDVQPFLFNLFNDKAIIAVPWPIRPMVAGLISTSRAEAARRNYAKMGGGSPLLAETQKQAQALEAQLNSQGANAKCFIAMRYWNPMIETVVREVKAWKPDRTVLLPLYPQFSTTTTGSSLEAWKKAGGPSAAALCCYPDQIELIEAHVERILECWRESGSPENIRLLLSAHGLPEKVVKSGDPYQWQVEQTCAAVIGRLPKEWDTEICFQSRVGPLKWIGPSTEDAIRRAGADGKTVLVSPIAFVSEHIETLVELDDEYGQLAKASGVNAYLRAPALGLSELFIDGLAAMVLQNRSPDGGISSSCGRRICPEGFSKCPFGQTLV